MKAIRIVLVDDHALVREGVRYVFEQQPGWKVCGQASTGREGVALAKRMKPDVVVQDMTLPELDGLEALRQIKKASPDTEIIIFTGHDTEDMVHQAFDIGARSYILKTDEPAHILAAVRAAVEHKPYFTPRISEIVLARYQRVGGQGERPAPGCALTPREREAVLFIAEGKSNKEIAAKMGVGLRTVESHRAGIMQKLGLQSLGELIRYAIRNGIIQP